MLQQINKENFQHMLGQFSTTELEGMIEKFPYFQQAHLLLAKKYQQENNPKFDQQLQLAALYIQDRELLYSLFNEKKLVSPPVVASTPFAEPKEEIKIEVKEQEETPVVSDTENITDALAEIKNSLNAIRQFTDEAEIKEVSAPEQTPVFEESTGQQLSPAIEPIVEIIIEEKQAPPVTSFAPETQEEAPAVITEPTLQEEEEPALEESSLIEEEIPVAVFSRIQPHTFDEWLHAFNNKSNTEIEEPGKVGEEEEDTPDELNQLLAENISVDYLHELVKEETNYSKGLERFIEEQIQKHKQSESTKKMPENSLDPSLITETMAKVYEIQKKYSKAIMAYESLTLKFPEKSSFFAARIHYLKNIT